VIVLGNIANWGSGPNTFSRLVPVAGCGLKVGIGPASIFAPQECIFAGAFVFPPMFSRCFRSAYCYKK